MKVIGSYLATLLMLTFSCSREEEQNPVHHEVNGPFTYRSVQDSNLTRKVREWQNTNDKTALETNQVLIKNRLEFDFEDLTIATMEGTAGQVIVANQVGYDAKAPVNYGIGFIELNDEIIGALLLSLEKKPEGMMIINYYSLEDKSSLRMEIDMKMKVVRAFDSNLQSGLKSAEDINGWGKRTMDCLADAYSNHGFVSVWAFVQTAFIPATAAALATACGIKNL